MADAWTWTQEHWEIIVGSSLALIGIVTTVWVALWQRQPKRMDYQIRYSLGIIAPGIRTRTERLKVLYDDQELADPHIAMVRIINRGKRAILADDRETPVVIRYGGTRIISVAVSGRSPDELSTKQLEGSPPNEAHFDLGLFNPGDWFDVQMVCDGKSDRFTARCRFADQQSPMREFYDVSISDKVSAVAAALVMVFCVVATALSFRYAGAGFWWQVTPAALIAITALIVGLLAAISWRRRTKR